MSKIIVIVPVNLLLVVSTAETMSHQTTVCGRWINFVIHRGIWMEEETEHKQK
jgi:hypothetical protein